MRERGLDPAKVEDEQMYSPQEVKSFAEEVLTHYDLLSDEPAEMYDPDRTGPAADGKWQVIVGDFTSLSVDGVRQRIVKVPNATMSAKKLFPVGLAHEIEGHSLQHTNKLSLGLQLFSRFGADRSVVFAEGGAKYNEDYVSQAAFGVPSRSHPHFIRAIARKLEGGTYTDCVQTFYDSAIEPYQKLHQEQKLTDEEFTQKVSYFAKLAVNRARRLFRDGGDYNSTDGRHLSNSKDTAYLEGLMLSEQLRKAELHKYMYLTGVNLDAILFLLRSGLLSTEDIRKPDYISLDIWEREKHKFAPDAAGEMPL
jgi:hypothetical protein